MKTSLYVAKADGERDILEDVSMETACDLFKQLDWDRELAITQADEKAGRDAFFPEFGLADEVERMLVVSPVDSDTVSFYYQDSKENGSVEKFPKGKIAELIGIYYAGDRMTEFVTKHMIHEEIILRELSESEFQATITAPMYRPEETEIYHRQAYVRDYVDKCITAFSLPCTLATIELAEIFLTTDKQHAHILFNYGNEATALVIVVHYDADNENSLVGHHFTNFNESCYRC